MYKNSSSASASGSGSRKVSAAAATNDDKDYSVASDSKTPPSSPATTSVEAISSSDHLEKCNKTEERLNGLLDKAIQYMQENNDADAIKLYQEAVDMFSTEEMLGGALADMVSHRLADIAGDHEKKDDYEKAEFFFKLAADTHANFVYRRNHKQNQDNYREISLYSYLDRHEYKQARCITSAADACSRRQGGLTKAENFLEQAINILRKFRRPPQDVKRTLSSFLFKAAVTCAVQGKLEKAAGLWGEAADVLIRLLSPMASDWETATFCFEYAENTLAKLPQSEHTDANKHKRVSYLEGAGNACNKQGDHETAGDFFTQAANLLTELKEPKNEDYEKTASLFMQAEHALDEAPIDHGPDYNSDDDDPDLTTWSENREARDLNQFQCLVGAGDAYAKCGKSEKALELWLMAAKTIRDLGVEGQVRTGEEERIQASCLNKAGDLYGKQGEPLYAVKTWLEAANILFTHLQPPREDDLANAKNYFKKAQAVDALTMLQNSNFDEEDFRKIYMCLNLAFNSAEDEKFHKEQGNSTASAHAPAISADSADSTSASDSAVAVGDKRGRDEKSISAAVSKDEGVPSRAKKPRVDSTVTVTVTATTTTITTATTTTVAANNRSPLYSSAAVPSATTSSAGTTFAIPSPTLSPLEIGQSSFLALP